LAFSRLSIKAHLERPRTPRLRGDVATAMALLAHGQLQPYDSATFGQLPTTPIPYTQGAGTPGARVKLTPAAVLVPLIERPEGFTLLLTKRTSDLKHHAGQVAFPGGRREPADADIIACALRETEEEVGLPPDPNEVADTFEVPLAFVMDPANHRREQRDYKGLTRAYYAMVYEERYIWGATAGMILNLFEVLSTEQLLGFEAQ
jgi:8-oxo-dGTP pyrophosphatase MutT (NUDIX family)